MSSDIDAQVPAGHGLPPYLLALGALRVWKLLKGARFTQENTETVDINLGKTKANKSKQINFHSVLGNNFNIDEPAKLSLPLRQIPEHEQKSS